VRRIGGEVVIGTITGSVSCDQLVVSGTGKLVLIRGAAMLAAGALLALLYFGGVALFSQIMVPLIPGLLGIAFLLFILRSLFYAGFGPRRHRGGGHGGGVGRLITSGAGGVARLAGTSMRAGAGGPHEYSTEVRRFRVTETSGRIVDCEFTGELHGAQLRQGDVVEVYGRFTGGGTLTVREVVVVANHATIRARPNAGYQMARAANLLAVVFVAACIGLAAYLVANR
jgi:hypothetical protein